MEGVPSRDPLLLEEDVFGLQDVIEIYRIGLIDDTQEDIDG